jgi:uncharacterized protein YndB with AHSA1/START domain
MTEDGTLKELSFTVSGRIARPCAEVYEAVADPKQLSQYFTTGGAKGRMESNTEVSWEFADFPGAFPVQVVEAEPPKRIVVEWEGREAINPNGMTRTTFEFEPVDDDTRTLVTITETSWRPSPEGAEKAFGNCEGWTGMLVAMKAWVEHGINLREGFYK